MWNYNGNTRPPYAIKPDAGQESVWDYPRPPRIEPCKREVLVRHGDKELARTHSALRVLETASPPTVYIPARDIDMNQLVKVPQQTFCEWKGYASYLGLVNAPDAAPVAWQYLDPKESFSIIRDHIAFYPGRVDCFLDGEPVRPQQSEFYGGWITNDIVGPCKGDPGTEGW